jgi:hypothetical protein
VIKYDSDEGVLLGTKGFDIVIHERERHRPDRKDKDQRVATLVPEHSERRNHRIWEYAIPQMSFGLSTRRNGRGQLPATLDAGSIARARSCGW